MKLRILAVAVEDLAEGANFYDTKEPGLGVVSPDGRYLLRLQHNPEAIYPVILLKDTRTGKETEVFNYDELRRSSHLAVWRLLAADEPKLSLFTREG